MDGSLGACTLSHMEETSFEIRPEVGVLPCALCGMLGGDPLNVRPQCKDLYDKRVRQHAISFAAGSHFNKIVLFCVCLSLL